MLRQVVQVFFWPVVIVASLFEAVAAASLTAALFSDPAPRRIFEDEPSHAEIFGRDTSLGWSSDRGFLIAAIVCLALAMALYVVAAHWARSERS